MLRGVGAEDIDITISLEVDADQPIADLLYRGRHWASVTRVGDELLATVYGPTELPLATALGALDEARERLDALE